MAQMQVTTYSPQDVKLVIGGYTIVGWDSITISRLQETFKVIRGIRGKHTRASSGDTSATLTVSLVQTSPSNSFLTEIHRLDEERGTGRLELTLKDNSGTSVFNSNEAYIVSYPEATNTAGIEMRNWNIFCQTTGSYVVGGNTKPETTIVDALAGVIGGNIF